MNTPSNKRLSLSSSSLSHRVKKFDSFSSSTRSNRATQRVTTSQAMRPESPRPQARSKAYRTVSPLDKSANNTQKNVTAKSSVQTLAPSSRNERSSAQRNWTSHSSQLNTKTQSLAMSAVQSSPASHRSVISEQFSGNGSRALGSQNKKRSLSHKLFYGLASAVFLFATAVSIQTLFTNQQTQQVLAEKSDQTTGQDSEGVAQGTGSDPAEEEVSNSALTSYQVSPELPRYLRIPKIDVFARIKHTGLDGTAVGAPTNIYDVSWFTDSAKPGNAIGSSLLLGHVQGWSAPGVFKKIDKLVPGDKFEVEKGSGETIYYEVTRTQDIPLGDVDMGEILSAENPGEHDIKLMTCSGEYNRDTELYESRYVVYAKVMR